MDELLRAMTAITPRAAASRPEIIRGFRTVAHKRGTLLAGPGSGGRYAWFVATGALRSYLVDEDGQERTLELSLEGAWVGDIDAFLTGRPSRLYVEVTEDAELHRIAYHDLEILLQSVPDLERYFRILYSYAYSAYFKRMTQLLSWPARRRYEHLREHQPELLERFPLKIIASYLGITPESLSRIRRG